jgi:DNA-binding CsgD family transcriptional regulator
MTMTGSIQIAIVSPEILGRIRQVFASRGLAVRIDRLPSLEFTVAPGPGAAPADAALRDALRRLVAPVSRSGPVASAHYQLSLVPVAAAAPAASFTRTAGHEAGHGAGAGPGAGRRVRASRAAHRPNNHPLSPREAEVMTCIGRGMGNADIAAGLRMSQKTVKNHVNHIFAKLGARNRVEAVLIWQGAADRRLKRPGAARLPDAAGLSGS